MLDAALPKLEQLIEQLITKNAALTQEIERLGQANAALSKTNEELSDNNETLQLEALELEEKHKATVDKIQALLGRLETADQEG